MNYIFEFIYRFAFGVRDCLAFGVRDCLAFHVRDCLAFGATLSLACLFRPILCLCCN